MQKSKFERDTQEDSLLNVKLALKYLYAIDKGIERNKTEVKKAMRRMCQKSEINKPQK